MGLYRYHVVPFVGQLKQGSDVTEVSNQLASLINHFADQGWEFYSLDNVDIQVTPGCLAGLFGAKTSYVTYNQVIFRQASGSAN
jgi:hypothetical protein